MKVFMTLLVRDEADIIALNLDYHLSRGISHFIVTDNGSVDGTREILARYESTGVVTVIDQPEHTYQQSSWVTHMNYVARVMGADAIINADADEFFIPSSGYLSEEFENRVGVQAFNVPVTNIALVRRADGSERFPRDTVFSIDSGNGSDAFTDGVRYTWPPKVMYRVQNFDVQVGMGNHSVSGLEVLGATRTRVAHYPFRSFKHFEQKVINGGSAYENSGMPEGTGYHWRGWYEMYKAGLLHNAYMDSASISADDAVEMLTSGRGHFVAQLDYLKDDILGI